MFDSSEPINMVGSIVATCLLALAGIRVIQKAWRPHIGWETLVAVAVVSGVFVASAAGGLTLRSLPILVALLLAALAAPHILRRLGFPLKDE